MIIGIPAEIHPGEKRIAASPEMLDKLIDAGFEVIVESGAGAGASFTDDAFREVGAVISKDPGGAWSADLVLKVRPPEFNPELDRHESEMLGNGSHLICFIYPAQNKELLLQLASNKRTVLAMDSIPRISRAQKLDALSSIANIAGYRAVVEASNIFGRFFSGQITAAGKVDPAKVLVIGAGVAGLSAIGSAKSMGAIVRSFDTRPEVKEQVESMDAEFLMLEFEDEDGAGEGGYAKVMSKEFIEAEMALFAEQAKDVDIIITTALIPGKPAPKLITKAMVLSMKEGSVIVDLAAEQGGNCECTVPGEITTSYGVNIVGYTDLPSRLAAQSSQLYATNLYNLIMELCPQKDGKIEIDMEDEVVRGATVVHQGEVSWPPPAVAVGAERKPSFSGQIVKPDEKGEDKIESEPSWFMKLMTGAWLPLIVAGLALFGLGQVAPPSFMSHFTVFVLSCFIGYMVIWNVTPSLHTPLMSVTNAISSIIVLGALTQISSGDNLIFILAAIAAFITCVNIVGGFSVTQRMLQMFRG